MFQTFTGSSKRPRNVNLSGQAGNPFNNTSWTPSLASNATKTVSDAQADRERRQLDRLRQKAAANIGRVWRGHQARSVVADARRLEFNDICRPDSASCPSQSLAVAFSLLHAFFSFHRADDVQRAVLFARLADGVPLDRLLPANAHPSRLRHLVKILVKSLDTESSKSGMCPDLAHLYKLVTRIVSHSPASLLSSVDLYYRTLAQLCRSRDAEPWKQLLSDAVTMPLRTTSESESTMYAALAYSFLATDDLVLFEEDVNSFADGIDVRKLAETIRDSYASRSAMPAPKDRLLSLLAHFIGLGRQWLNPLDNFIYLSALFSQLSFLSSEISAWLGSRPVPVPSSNQSSESSAQPYVSRLLLSLVDEDGISKLLHDFSASLAQTSVHKFQGTSVLAGYTLTLLHCFPASADDTRMRLFLEQIPTASGQVPTVKFLWQMMKETSVFKKLKTESEQPFVVLARYIHSTSQLLSETIEEQEWRIVLLFLELYIFVLRLSDDQDFFSGMTTRPLEVNAPNSRLRSCSLPLEDVKSLTIFLKNAAFVLHYKANEVASSQRAADASANSRLGTYLGGDRSCDTTPADAASASPPSTKLGLDGLRSILTTPLKMLYERDSRKHFMAAGDWLMTGKVEQEDFINAVIEEEQRRNREESGDSGETEDSDEEAGSIRPDYDSDSELHSTMMGQRLSRHARLERLRTQQRRAQRERRLAEMGPKLEILKHMPFVVPFETRVKIFRQFVNLDSQQRGVDGLFQMFHMHPSGRHHAKIRRGQIFEDAYEHFYQLGEGLKDPIQITFVDRFDTQEAGIDGGGVTKEFLTSVTSEAFATQNGAMGMFVSNEQGLLFPNPTATDTLRESLKSQGWTEKDPEWKDAMTSLFRRFEFLGRIVGKCLYEGILVDLAFAGFFLLKWPSVGPKLENTYKGSINDLRDMDEDLYKGMLRLKNYPGDVLGLGFDFTVEDQVSAPGEPMKTITRRLILHGDQTSVDNDNRLLYISYMARHRLVVQPAPQTAAFLRGLHAIIRPSWLSMFNQSELQRLVGGDSSEIDVADLRRNTVYSGLYEIGDDQEEHPTIKLFWKVMEGFADSQRRDVLKYVSSTPRAPLLGFSQLRPKFSIRDGGTDEERLPSTSTCVNLLKLPRYTQEERLREKLLYAVTSGAGFDLS
ncbi:hypothetical protein L249_2698 [Ophiocordyceps polyrhachis-furcata BCC 54312]|uniref:HECT-type E3 ubiquitin transferase n=1 Tax=Ophiocordyceps polyrhachis-furcata BCC 54312 TaxID=1330021 RepID=A0A367LRV8_9HYPO|nr:hypothetical protein L249_2698 [Ophiocordyceps polyrhachis-furcata BCC 54312]